MVAQEAGSNFPQPSDHRATFQLVTGSSSGHSYPPSEKGDHHPLLTLRACWGREGRLGQAQVANRAQREEELALTEPQGSRPGLWLLPLGP